MQAMVGSVNASYRHWRARQRIWISRVELRSPSVLRKHSCGFTNARGKRTT